MKQIVYKLPFSLILFAGLFVGLTKGQDVRQKWVNKWKNRYTEKGNFSTHEIVLDDFEMATYHS